MFDLNYYVLCYKVEFFKKGSDESFDRTFDTDEDAIDFIKTNRAEWEKYRLLLIQWADIDF